MITENIEGNSGENSNDECCLCGELWLPSSKGWPLCDTPDCENVCCSNCSQALIVSEVFYCPPCAGAGRNAAAAVGGAVATTVKVCSELEKLPLSQNAIKTILRNLLKDPENLKFRKLRLNNPKVKSLLDIDPCRRLLTFVGFSDKQDSETHEPLLLLEGKVDMEEVKQLLDIMESLSDDSVKVDGNLSDSNKDANAAAAAQDEVRHTEDTNNDSSKRSIGFEESDAKRQKK